MVVVRALGDAVRSWYALITTRPSERIISAGILTIISISRIT